MHPIFGRETPLEKPKSYVHMSNKDLLRLYRDSIRITSNPDWEKDHEGYFVKSREALILIEETILKRME